MLSTEFGSASIFMFVNSLLAYPKLLDSASSICKYTVSSSVMKVQFSSLYVPSITSNGINVSISSSNFFILTMLLILFVQP